MKIQEIIVVEGKGNTRRLWEIVDVDTIEAIGSVIDEEILMQIEHAQETREVIVPTGPDFSGGKIRKIIMEAVPQVKYAFLPYTQAKPKKKGSLGAEYVSDAAILEALKEVVTSDISQMAVSEITRRDSLDYGLIVGAQTKEKREKLDDESHVGYTGGKRLKRHLKMFHVTPKELAQIMKIVGEQHEWIS